MSEQNVGDAKPDAPKRPGNPDLVCEMHQAISALASVIHLLKHYKDHDDLGEDTDECWYGLSLILNHNVLEVLIAAKDSIERQRFTGTRSR